MVEIPLTDTMKTFIGILGVLTVTLLILMVAYYARKVLGRRPPLSEEVAMLDKTLRREIKIGDATLQDQIIELRRKHDSILLNCQQCQNETRRDIERHFMQLLEKLDIVKGELLTDSERRDGILHKRVTDIKGLVERLDERTTPK